MAVLVLAGFNSTFSEKELLPVGLLEVGWGRNLARDRNLAR